LSMPQSIARGVLASEQISTRPVIIEVGLPRAVSRRASLCSPLLLKLGAQMHVHV
jgi:hypothetical protein